MVLRKLGFMLGREVKGGFRESETLELKQLRLSPMAGARKRGILSRGNNKLGDEEGWTDVTGRGDYNSSGKPGPVFPRECSGGEKQNVSWLRRLENASYLET